MNKKEELIPIGIASSVASESGFNWMKTVEIANKLDVSVLQLHLSQYCPEFDWDTNLADFNQVYMHLPANFYHSNPFINSIKTLSNKPLLIQHECYLNQKDVLFFKKYQFFLGFENDPNNNLNNYFKQIKKLYSEDINLSAVLDLPRFFQQFQIKYKEKEIYNYIIQILEWCKDINIPVIIHAIDIDDYNAEPSKWVPIFEGILPWKNLLFYVVEKSIPVQSIIFEYEDVVNTEKSVYSLREWFKK